MRRLVPPRHKSRTISPSSSFFASHLVKKDPKVGISNVDLNHKAKYTDTRSVKATHTIQAQIQIQRHMGIHTDITTTGIGRKEASKDERTDGRTDGRTEASKQAREGQMY